MLLNNLQLQEIISYAILARGDLHTFHHTNFLLLPLRLCMGACPVRAAQQLPVRQGNSSAGSARARRFWRIARQQVCRLLRLRRRWAALGLYLQGSWIQDLFQGLERQKGKLFRKSVAPLRR